VVGEWGFGVMAKRLSKAEKEARDRVLQQLGGSSKQAAAIAKRAKGAQAAAEKRKQQDQRDWIARNPVGFEIA
jgi:hypothetical protein